MSDELTPLGEIWLILSNFAKISCLDLFGLLKLKLKNKTLTQIVLFKVSDMSLKLKTFFSCNIELNQGQNMAIIELTPLICVLW